jgi:hypothetical protein
MTSDVQNNGCCLRRWKGRPAVTDLNETVAIPEIRLHNLRARAMCGRFAR